MAIKNYEFKQIASGILVPALVLFIGFGAYFLILPKYREIKADQQQLEQKLTEATDQQAQLDDIEKLIDNYNAKKEEMKKINKSIPTSPQIPQLLSDMQNVSDLSGVVINDFQIELIQAQTVDQISGGTVFSSKIANLQKIQSSADMMETMEMTISLTADYPAFKAFLENIQLNLRMMDVSEIAVDSPDDESGDQEFLVKILTYYQNEDG